MLGIPRVVTKHTLKICPGSKPVKQRLCRFDEEKRRTIGEEIAKLLVARFIKEVYHLEWLGNPILVLKKSGKWGCVLTTRISTSVPKGFVSFAMHRSDSRLDLGVRNPVHP